MKGLPRASWESVHSTVPLLCLVPGMKLAQDRAVSRVHLADPGNEHKEGPKPSGRYGNDQREVWLSSATDQFGTGWDTEVVATQVIITLGVPRSVA